MNNTPINRLRDGRFVAPETYDSAKRIIHLYQNMSLEALIGFLFDFDRDYDNAGLDDMSSNYLKYRRGYLIKCNADMKRKK